MVRVYYVCVGVNGERGWLVTVVMMKSVSGGRERVVADRGEIEKDVCGVGHVSVRYPLPKPSSASLLLSAPLSLPLYCLSLGYHRCLSLSY